MAAYRRHQHGCARPSTPWSTAAPRPTRCAAQARLDLADEPIVLSVPETCGRYYALWLRNEAGKVFASIGARTTGTDRRTFVVLGPRPTAVARPGTHPSSLRRGQSTSPACIEAVDEATRWRDATGFQLAAVEWPASSGRLHAAGEQDWPDPVADAVHTCARPDVDRRPLSGDTTTCCASRRTPTARAWLLGAHRGGGRSATGTRWRSRRRRAHRPHPARATVARPAVELAAGAGGHVQRRAVPLLAAREPWSPPRSCGERAARRIAGGSVVV